MKNFGSRNGNYETNAVVKNQETKQREQRTLGDCWQWKANGQCSKGDNCSFRHDINKRAKMTVEYVSEFFHAEKCIENQKTQRQCRCGEKCSYAHRQVDEQPGERSKKNGDKSAVAMLKSAPQLGCVFQDMEPPKSSSILQKSSNIWKPIRCVRFTNAVVRHANIRD